MARFPGHVCTVVKLAFLDPSGVKEKAGRLQLGGRGEDLHANQIWDGELGTLQKTTGTLTLGRQSDGGPAFCH